MHATLRTVSRAALRAPTPTMSVNCARRMTTAAPSSEFPDIRDSAVRDAIMDKLWEAGKNAAAGSGSASAPAADSTVSATKTNTTQAPRL